MVLALGCAWACSSGTARGSGSDGDGGAAGVVSPEALQPGSFPSSSSDSTPPGETYDALVDAICRSILTCKVPNDDLLFPAAVFEQRGGSALDNCREYYRAEQAQEYLSRYVDASRRGALEIDWTVLGDATGCNALLDYRLWYRGLLTPGSACQLNVECARGYCDVAMGCPGRCVAGADDGQACDHDDGCGSGHCGSDFICAERRVSTGAAEGQACQSFGANVVSCQPELWCNRDTETCERPIGALQPCSGGDDVCESGHVCVKDATGGHRCKRLQVQSLGDPCDTEDTNENDLRICDYIAVDECVDGTCIHRQEGREGDACTRTEVDDTCAVGFTCSWETDSCVALLPDGQSCSSSQDCENHCNFSTGVCEPLYCDPSH